MTVIKIITVITFDDEIQKKANADEERTKLKEAAIEVTGSDKKNVFIIANSVGAQEDQDLEYKRRVLVMLEQALKCGERSIRLRQNTEPPESKKWWSLPVSKVSKSFFNVSMYLAFTTNWGHKNEIIIYKIEK